MIEVRLVILFLILLLIISFVFNKSHIIVLLLILECIILILLVYLFFILIEITSNPNIFLLILSFRACEAALGLSILVSLMRYYGNDSINTIIRLKWFA